MALPSENLSLGDRRLSDTLPELQASLSRIEFPQSAKDLLLMLSSYCKSYEAGKQPQPLVNPENIVKIVDEFIFCCTINFKHLRKRLTAKQELQLLELLCGYFENQSNDATRNAVFNILFSSASLDQNEEYKRNILYKLVSLAIAVRCTVVLNCTAILMTQQVSKHWLTDLASALVHDYCMLVPGSLTTLHTVASFSPLFACQFLTALTQLYKPSTSLARLSSMPIALLEAMTDWVCTQPMLCLSHINHHLVSGSLQSYQLHTKELPTDILTPIAGLINCCVLAPMMEADVEWKTHLVYSNLHFGVLETMIAYATLLHDQRFHSAMNFNRGLLSVMDIRNICDKVKIFAENSHPSKYETAVDRLAQATQVALSTGSLPCHKDDLKNAFVGLRQTRLLQIVLSHMDAGQRIGSSVESMPPVRAPESNIPMQY
ncbi:integrator complex subunit 15-like [Glandiceps talaboti]